jgi:RNA polymerase sigma-70 factor (ECF subfamily)
MIETEEEKNKFELIYERYRKLMFYIANQILHDEDSAEDAVHDTFVKILENMDKIELVDSGKTKSFVAIMVQNHSINIYNRRKRFLNVPLEDYENILFDDILFKNVTENDLAESDMLGKAIMKLPVIYRDILTLKFVHELSNSEIAALLNISEAAVRKRIQRAKNKIHELIDKGGVSYVI